MSQAIDRNIQSSRFRRAESCRPVQTSCVHEKEDLGSGPCSTDCEFCLCCSASATSASLFHWDFWINADQQQLMWKSTADGQSADWVLSLALRFSCSCHVDPVGSSRHVFGGSDRLGFCVAVWADLRWAIRHMFGLCVQFFSWCFLAVTCAFSVKRR